MLNNILYKNLKIIHINVNSIISISRRYELQTFLKLHDPDIVLLNETKLNKLHKVYFNNYNMIRNDRKDAKQGGGTAILIKDIIKYEKYVDIKISELKILLRFCICMDLSY